LRKQLEQKKKAKKTSSKDDKDSPSDDDSTSSDHSSEKRRKSRKKPMFNRCADLLVPLAEPAVGISAFAYLRDRLSGSLEMPSLAQSILHHANPGPASG